MLQAGRYRRLPSDFLLTPSATFAWSTVTCSTATFPAYVPPCTVVVTAHCIFLAECLHSPLRAGFHRPQFGVVLDGDAGTAFFHGSGGFLLPSIVLGFQLAPLQGNPPPAKARLRFGAPPGLARQDGARHPKYGRARRSFFFKRTEKKSKLNHEKKVDDAKFLRRLVHRMTSGKDEEPNSRVWRAAAIRGHLDGIRLGWCTCS